MQLNPKKFFRFELLYQFSSNLVKSFLWNHKFCRDLHMFQAWLSHVRLTGSCTASATVNEPVVWKCRAIWYISPTHKHHSSQASLPWDPHLVCGTTARQVPQGLKLQGCPGLYTLMTNMMGVEDTMAVTGQGPSSLLYIQTGPTYSVLSVCPNPFPPYPQHCLPLSPPKPYDGWETSHHPFPSILVFILGGKKNIYLLF